MGNQNETFFASCFFPEILMFPSTLFLPARKKRLLFSFVFWFINLWLWVTQNIVQLQFLPEQFHCNVGYQTTSPRNPPTRSHFSKRKSKLLPACFHIFPIKSSKHLPKIIRFSSSKHPKKKLCPKRRALVEFPPQKELLSKSSVRPPCSTTVLAADMPARPPPTTMTWGWRKMTGWPWGDDRNPWEYHGITLMG